MTAIINDEASRVRTQVQSQPGRALTFDGVNDYVSLGSPSALQLSSGSWVISYWKRSTSVVEGSASCGTAAWIVSSSRFYYRGAWRNWAVSEPLTDAWAHIAIVYDLAATTLYRYINGSLTDTVTGVTGAHGAGGEVRIGNYGGSYFNGKMHDFRVYDRALTATEICNLYNATKQSGGDVAGTLYAANLIGWWPLEEINISSIRDASGNDYHGTQSGTVTLYTGADVPCSIKNELGYTLDAGEEYYADASDPTKDIQGNALGYPGPLAKRALPKASPCATFDGTNDYALSGITPFNFERTQAFSGSAWVYSSSYNTHRIIMGNSLGTGTWRGWVLDARSGAARKLQFDLISTINTNHLSVYTTSDVLLDSTWQHVSFTYDGTSTTAGIKLYVNGVSIPTSVGFNSLSATTLSDGQMSIGAYSAPANFFPGRMADLRVFDRILAPSEVASVYAGNNITSGLVAHWPCAEKSLKLLTDISGNGNNALATGMTSGELWANTQDVYHAGLTAGVRTTNGRRGYRYFNGTNQHFNRSHTTDLEISDGDILWAFARIRAESFDAANGSGILGVYTNEFQWLVYLSNNIPFVTAFYDTISRVVSSSTALSTAVWYDIFAYIDARTGQVTVGIAVDNGAFVPASVANPIRESSSIFTVGVFAGSNFYAHHGDMQTVAVGKLSAIPASWSDFRNEIRNSGNPLTYNDLTPTQISDWGIISWYDCDEWGPQLRDKHSDNHLTGANYSTDYPVPAVPALLAAPTHEYGTFSKELAGAFNGGHDAKYACTTGQKLWVAAMVRINHYSTAGDGIASKYSSSTEWSLHVAFSTNNRVYFLAYDSANALKAAVATSTPINDWMFVFAYIDATTAMSLGLSIDGGSFATDSSANGPRAGTDSFQIGNLISTNYLHGDIEYVAIGKAPLVSFSDVRDMLYSGGVPLRFGDLTAAQKTTIGLQDWFDVGEYDGSLTLTGKHAASALTGFCIPSAITHGGPKKLPAIDTAIDFTGGVAAPWTDKQYLGYLTCSGAANGRVVTAATAGKFASGNVSVYVRLRNLVTSADRNFLDFDNSGANRGLFGFKTTGALFHIYDGSYRDLGASAASLLADGEWHDLLFVWNGTLATLYIDNVLWGTSAIGNSATVSALWTRGTVLSDYGNVGKVVGDIARLIVSDGVRVPGNITTAPNILDLRFDSPNCEDELGRIPSSAWLTGHTPAKLTVPTAYKHGVILPEGMTKSASELSERQFRIFKKDQ